MRNMQIGLVVFGCLLYAVPGSAHADEDSSWFDHQTLWHDFPRYHFKVSNRAAYLVVPKDAVAGKPWIWRARFPDYHAEMDVALLRRGYHVAYVDVAGLFGSPEAVEVGNKFYEYLTRRRGLAAKPVLEGVSRGGLFVYNWAAKNSERVAAIYCDTPVCDFKSWPGGKGRGMGSTKAWQQCRQAYGLSEAQAEQYAEGPLDRAEVFAKAKIPILHVVSENDRVVPPHENTYLLKKRLEKLGHALDVLSVAEGTSKSNGHHFTHPDPERVVRFIERRANHTSAANALLKRAKRILFLGDSITYAGHYVAHFDAWLLTQPLKKSPLVINAGLPSETVSGLSEKGHAGGRFPRPDLASRLASVLRETQPDLVLACYGINCGIYQPFDEGRFQSYQRGIKNLKEQVERAGATLVLVTPPSYDDQRAKKSFSYDTVLARYSEWLLARRKDGWFVIDLHGPMVKELHRRRASDASFTFQPDAVHPNADGHWFIAQRLIGWFGDEQAATSDSPAKMLEAHQIPVEVLKPIRQRLNLLRDAYLSAARHQRPGIKAGLPLEQARQQAEPLTKAILKFSGR